MKNNLLLALDLSIKRTGYAIFNIDTEGHILSGSIPTKGTKKNPVPKFQCEHEKYGYIAESILSLIGDKAKNISYIIAEDYAYSGSSMSKLAECNGAIGLRLWDSEELDFHNRLTVAIKSVKKYASGDGSADKKLMMESVCKRWGFCSAIDDESDAYAIGMVGLMVLNNTPQNAYERQLRERVIRRNKKKLPKEFK